MQNWLSEIRKDKNMTHEEIATQSNITRQFYSMIEAGHRTPSVQTAKRIADVLGFKWTRFFDEEKKTG